MASTDVADAASGALLAVVSSGPGDSRRFSQSLLHAGACCRGDPAADPTVWL